MDAKPRSTKRGPAIAILAVPLLLASYLLSVGPAYAVVRHTPQQEEFAWDCYLTAYAPLIWLASRSPTFDAWLVRYGELCVGE